VRTLIFLIFASVVSAWGQSRNDGFVALSFAIDGSPARCAGFQVKLGFQGKAITPIQNERGFEVPETFKRPANKWKKKQRVDISLTCNEHTLIFPGQHPAFLREGDWQLGIAHPLYAVKEYGYTHEFDHGAWLGYLIFTGEPGVVTFSSQPNPPSDLSVTLQKEQLGASPERLRDIAYMLAVFNVDYQKNRDYLLSSLKNCLSRPKESQEDDVCDGDLLSFLTNLYWRGDTTLLPILLQIAESRRDVIGDIGTFYADLLDRRGVIVLNAMGASPDDEQQLVCKLADDDLSINSPKRKRIKAFLHKARNRAATQCLAGLGNG
jgi:hypothetical protein